MTIWVALIAGVMCALAGTAWAPRHAASVFVHDNALWMVAGNNMTSDVWKLTRVK